MNTAGPSLRPLLDPRSIAYIGASNDPKRIGGMPIAHALRFGFAGALYPVNPKYGEIQGLRAWADVESLPEAPDLAVLAISADDVLPMLERCHARGIASAMVYAAGFAETRDEAGRARQCALQAFAERTGMLVAGPNLMGFANLRTQAHTAFASVFDAVPMQQAPGNVALLTQSGNACAALYALVRRAGLGVSHFINTGNEACVEFAQYLQHLADDDGTEIVLGYIESLRDGPRFRQAMQRMQALGKVLIALKAGTTDAGSQAVQAHTSALAGDRRIYRAAFEQLGVIEADDFAQMAQLARLARLRGRAAGTRVGVMTISGAMGAILADRFAEQGLALPRLPDDVQQVLRAGIPDYGMVDNPVDVTGNVVNDPAFVRTALTTLATTDALDVVVVAAPGYLLDRMADDLCTVAAETPRLLVAIDTGQATCRDRLDAAGVAVFDDVGVAVRALGPFLRWKRQQALPLPVAPPAALHTAPPDAASADEVAVRGWLAGFGLPSPAEQLARSADEAVAAAEALGGPVAMKIVSPAIAHKTEIGGVRLGLQGAAQVREAYDAIVQAAAQAAPQAPMAGVLVQRMERGVAELILGATRDPVFGMTLTVGLGGVMTELFGDAAHRLLPVDARMARAMLQQLKSWPLLDGFRGRAKADVDAACEAIAAFARAAAALPASVAALEVNPLLVRAAGQGVCMLDALLLPAAPADLP